MKVEVGDWVKLHGKKRIYEVAAVNDIPYSTNKQIALVGMSKFERDYNVTAVAPRFWIRKAEKTDGKKR